MDMLLFVFGLLGALMTVYLAKQEVIPEFRPLFDTSGKENESRERRNHIKKTEKDIDEVQAKLREESLPAEVTGRLTTVLKTSLTELEIERGRLRSLEREIKQSQVVSRSLGFLFYIALGGVFGSLLAGRVEVGGLTGDLPNYIESIVIGATWTTYLSTIGVRMGQKKVDERIEAGLKGSAERISSAKKEITSIVAEEIAKAEKADKVEQPLYADAVARLVADKLDLAMVEVNDNMNLTRQMVQKDVKGVL